MPNRATDPLLLAGKILALLLQAAMVVGGVALFAGTIIVFLYRDRAVAEYAAEIGDPSATFPVFALIGVMLIGLAIVGLLFVFFGRLRRIIASVGEGDPFEPANADRLSLMAWLMLAVQILLLPAIALGEWLAGYADELEDANITVDGGMDLTGMLLVVILFILARVFRHGAAMREDLEGTV